jgi:hypothetical protein
MSDSVKLRNTKRLFGFLGIVVLAGAVWSFESTSRFLKTAQPADAIVVAIESGSSGVGASRSTSDTPVVQFKTAAGEVVVARASFGSGGLLGGYVIGEKLSILYAPQQPDNFCEAGWWGTWGATIVILILGLGFIAGGLFGTLVPA